MNNIDQARLEALKIAALEAQSWANYWSHFAISETNRKRTVTKGCNGPRLTPDELEEDAFATARGHILRLQELQTEVYKIIHKQ